MRPLIAIDRGGTFTDAVLWDQVTGEQRLTKVLSGPNSPLTAIRHLLGLGPDDAIPPCDVRLGTTVATNALLERKGRPTGLIITRGFKDLLCIGTQARPHLFELDIQRPEPLYRAVAEVDARLTASGQVLLRPRQSDAEALYERYQKDGITSLAIVVLHAHKNPELELELGDWARPFFDSIVLSHQASREEGLLARASTTVLEAFLGPALDQHLADLAAELPGSDLLVMQSSGGLSKPEALRGPAALLSGPAGGVVAGGRIAERLGTERLITLDMGGTSTDVSVVPLGPDLVLESELAGVTVRSPMVDVRTVAAGGSSICSFDGHSLTVGPDSVGSRPGPLCFGSAEASELSLTDVDLLLGRLAPDCFPIPLSFEPARAGALRVLERVHATGHQLTLRDLLLGFRRIAAAHMAAAIRQVTVDRGLDPRASPLLVFGGAAGQHACEVARALGVTRIVVHRASSVLSALGIALADETALESSDAGRARLDDLKGPEAERAYVELEARARARLAGSASSAEWERAALLAYRGTSTALPVSFDTPERMLAEFERAHRQKVGFLRTGTPVVVQSLRLLGRRRSVEPSRNDDEHRPAALARSSISVVLSDGSEAVVPLLGLPLPPAALVPGPALLVDETSTIWVEPGFVARPDGELLLIESLESAPADTASTALDPALLEVMSARFMSIAQQMGRTLARSAQSTNIRERLDFSCAVFDRECRLVANAPHIPVHLGAMGDSVRAVLRAFPELAHGQVALTNDPAAGGSHLPDITVITPVFSPDGPRPAYFVASRGHHADVGGMTPGSMPPHATTLAEEGVVLPPLLAVAGGLFQEESLRHALTAGPWPARDVEQNLGDLRAQIAANRLGAELLLELEAEVTSPVVQAYMQHLLEVSAAKVEAKIAELPGGRHRASLAMDDGTRLEVTLTVQGQKLVVDFTGTSPEVESNFNAPRSVTQAAVLYFVRTLTGHRLPLTDGCLWPVTLVIPPSSILDPSPGRAVSSGNVETSMQICDLLFRALGLCAASQGTMNNLTFGNRSFGYYETIAGGAGAGPAFDGQSGVHTHMTNTRITDAEVLESRYPVRLWRFELRAGSGGAGLHRGGDGLLRELEALAPLAGNIVSERRRAGSPGLSGGDAGRPGRNTLGGVDLGGKATFDWAPGQRLCIETPGGGGYGVAGGGAAGSSGGGGVS